MILSTVLVDTVLVDIRVYRSCVEGKRWHLRHEFSMVMQSMIEVFLPATDGTRLEAVPAAQAAAFTQPPRRLAIKAAAVAAAGLMPP